MVGVVFSLTTGVTFAAGGKGCVLFDGGGVTTGFSTGTVVVEEGVAGVGVGLPGPPGPRGT